MDTLRNREPKDAIKFTETHSKFLNKNVEQQALSNLSNSPTLSPSAQNNARHLFQNIER